LTQQALPQNFTGTRDWFGDDERIRQGVIKVIREVYESFGFEPLSTPAIEYQHVLFRESGETAQKVFDISIKTRGYDDLTKKRREKSLGLRYDHTVPLARVVAQHQRTLVLPYKRYAIGPVWRPEKPQKGRFREFYQVDFDTVGASSVSADAEVIAVLCTAVNAVGIQNYSAVFNHRVLLDGMARALEAGNSEQVTEMLRSWDKLGKVEYQEVPEKLAIVGLNKKQIERFLATTEELKRVSGSNADIISAVRSMFKGKEVQEGLSEIERLLEIVSAYQVVGDHLKFVPNLARGFAYYTGPVFELVSHRSRNSFAGGGRFDHLIEALGGPDIPATGASFGLERFVELIRTEGDIASQLNGVDVFVTIFSQNAEFIAKSSAVAERLRSEGLRVELYAGADSIGRQLAVADKKKIGVAIIIGPSEVSSGNATVKDLLAELVEKDKQSNQRTVSEEDLVRVVREILTSQRGT